MTKGHDTVSKSMGRRQIESSVWSTQQNQNANIWAGSDIAKKVGGNLIYLR